MFKTSSRLSFKQCEAQGTHDLSVICFVKERCEIIKYPFRLSKISLDISDIPCYTFQFVRRFGSGEEPNYTPAGENSQYFQRDFFGEIRHVAVG
ncbi:hypothetical protein NGFG_02472 [Neisseria gonorrhoeae MS11]|nr:hypothetical protein NGFG_02472 [Neisseria gonorrhoeae MS11]